MATYAGVQAVMAAIEGMLNEQLGLLPAALNAKVSLFGSQTFQSTSIANNTLGLWLYRISVDPTVPGGYARVLPGAGLGRLPELSVMLHFLMIAISDTPESEYN